jgi:hypothetical protein
MRCFRLSISMFGCFCHLLACAYAFAGPTSQPAMISFPITSQRHLLTIPVTLNQQSACFLFDTGSSETALDSAAFPNLQSAGPTAAAITTGGEINVGVFAPPKLSVGPWNLQDSGPVYRLDLSPLRRLTGVPIMGVLGANVWRTWVIQMDFDARQLRFFRPDGQPHPEWGTSIPVETEDARGDSIPAPAIRLTVGDFTDLFAIDSGAIENNLPTIYGFDCVLRATSRPAITTPELSAAGRADVRMLRSPEFQISGLHYRDLLFGESKDWQGGLGLDFLSRHLVTLDCSNHKLYLKPGKEFNRYDEHDMSGLELERVNSKIIILTASPQRPAYEAGLRVGDELLEINGSPTDKSDLYDLRALLSSKDGLKITMKYKRDPSDQIISFLLRKEI